MTLVGYIKFQDNALSVNTIILVWDLPTYNKCTKCASNKCKRVLYLKNELGQSDTDIINVGKYSLKSLRSPVCIEKVRDSWSVR